MNPIPHKEWQEDAAGLYPSSRGARIRFSTGGKKTVIDGPFTETKELVGGYWIIEVKSLEEAIVGAKRAPWRRMDRTRRPMSKCESLLRSTDFPPRLTAPRHDQQKAATSETAVSSRMRRIFVLE